MKLVVLPQAADEFEDAVVYYEDKQPGLGKSFRDEVDRHMRWIVGHASIPRYRKMRYFPSSSGRPLAGVSFVGLERETFTHGS